MELILVRPDDMEKGSAYRFSDQIINTLRKSKEIGLVGIGNAISLTSMAVCISTNIANVSIAELSLDYIGSPTLGIGGIFFILDRESKVDWNKKSAKLDEGMKLDFSRDGQLLVISRSLLPEKIIPLSLSKISNTNMLKINARGVAINRAVNLALELSKGNIAKEALGIKLVALSTYEHKIEYETVLGTSISVYLEKGAKTVYSKKHKQLLKALEGT